MHRFWALCFRFAAAMAAAAVFFSPAQAQWAPSKPFEFVVPAGTAAHADVGHPRVTYCRRAAGRIADLGLQLQPVRYGSTQPQFSAGLFHPLRQQPRQGVDHVNRRGLQARKFAQFHHATH